MMIYYILASLMLIHSLQAGEAVNENSDPLTVIAPTLPLNRPYELAGLQNPELVQLQATERIVKNKKIIESRAFPWSRLLVGSVAIAVVFILRKREALGWKPVRIEKTEEQVRQEALSELNNLSAIKDSKLELTSLDKVVREYLEGAHHIDTVHSTSEEVIDGLFQSKIGGGEEIQKFASLYHEINVGKYSAEKVTFQKTQQLVSVASKIISQLGKK